jgi:aspartate kinase
VIIGITAMIDRVQVTMETVDNHENKKYADVLNEIAKNKISIDLINIFPKEKIFTIDKNAVNSFKSLMDELEIKYSLIEDCTKISVVGSRIRGVPGVMAKIISALEKEGITVLQTADSHTTIWCLVHSSNAEKAIVALHKDFNLGN